MKGVVFLVRVAEKLGKAVRAWWHALVAPEETRMEHRVSVANQVVDVAEKLTRSEQQFIEWKTKQLRDLGLSDEEVREKMLVEIDRLARTRSTVGDITQIASAHNRKDEKEGNGPPLLE